MSKTTIGEFISRIRNRTKTVRVDAFLTDRFFYSLIAKNAKALMKREDGRNHILSFRSVAGILEKVDLVEVDLVEAHCAWIRSCNTVRRTEHKMPLFMQGYNGPLIILVTSLDGSQKVWPTTPADYANISSSKNFRYNKKLYYWFLNDYLYFPNLEWDAVKIEGIFEDDISEFSCDRSLSCLPRQDQPFNVPDYLHAELEALVIKDFIDTYKIPSDPEHDNINPNR